MATATVAMATLLASLLPLAAADAQENPQATVTTSASGARAVELSSAQRNHLLKAAADTSADTAESLKLGDEEKLIPRDVISDTDGTVHTRYERTFAGLPVLGGDLVVHERAGDRTVTKASRAALTLPTTRPTVTGTKARTSALDIAEREKTRKAAVNGAPRLVVWMATGKPSLAWESSVTGVQKDGTPSRLQVVTDAKTGKQLASVEQVHSGTGTGQNNGTVRIGSVRNGDVFELVDADRGNHGTYDYDTRQVMTDDDDVWGDGTPSNRQTAAVDAAYGAQQTWDFFHSRYGRDGIAGNGVGVRSYVHVGDGYVNAYWDDACFCMNYGDGEDNARPLTALDIAGHEMTHGITSATADLLYSGESGGLNEATSDIMGTAVEFFTNSPKDVPDYLIAEKVDVYGTGVPLRYMDQPSKDDVGFGGSQDYWTTGTKYLDPHQSSGPANHFFYLLSEGSGKKTINGIRYDSPTSDGRKVAGIGRESATDIWYRALTVYMTSTTDFAGARTATLQAAADLYGMGSKKYEAVGNAWAAVQVGYRYVHHIAVDSTNPRRTATGQSVTWQIQAQSSRPGALRYSAKGLPRGMSLDARTGLVAGVPAKGGEFRPSITVKDAAGDSRTVRYQWTVLASGGDVFVNPNRYDIPNWAVIESPVTVSGRKGNAPADLKVTIDLYAVHVGFYVIDLVSEDGRVIPVKGWSQGPVAIPELHETFTVDASAIPADGTWNLRVRDNTPGNFHVLPGYLDTWSISF
ncbi:M4 family metallopeptidase [Streptomyces sp. NBC_00316]|uniref:M4 family metallopeptidase n=1 Tax=Streptomyces sp. NBC_00316 TaxID=2975710 RepID=UPI002E2E5F8D|nr:M4 family metallopeptidase [Streptomyces sp. NBC_00316]